MRHFPYSFILIYRFLHYSVQKLFHQSYFSQLQTVVDWFRMLLPEFLPSPKPKKSKTSHSIRHFLGIPFTFTLSIDFHLFRGKIVLSKLFLQTIDLSSLSYNVPLWISTFPKVEKVQNSPCFVIFPVLSFLSTDFHAILFKTCFIRAIFFLGVTILIPAGTL